MARMTDEQIERWREEVLIPFEKLANELRDLSIKLPRSAEIEEIEEYYQNVTLKYKEFEKRAQEIKREALAYSSEANWNNIVSSAINQFMFITLEILNYRQKNNKNELSKKISELEGKQKIMTSKADEAVMKNDETTKKYVKLEKDINGNQEIIRNFSEKSKEIDKIMSNIYGFCGIIVGLLTLIFINFQLITSATSLSLGKMIIYLGVANVILISGILIILAFLGFVLDRWNRWTIGFSILLVIILCFFSSTVISKGLNIYEKIDKPENRDIIKRIEILEGNKSTDNPLDVNIKGEKSITHEEEIKKLKSEIENLKNKK